MLVKVMAVTLVYTIMGAKAEVTSNFLANALMNYNNKLSSSSKTSLYDSALIDVSKLNVKSVNLENLQSIIKLTINDNAKQPLKSNELEELRTRLSLSALEVNKLFNKIADDLIITLTPFSDELHSKVTTNIQTIGQKLNSLTLDLSTKLVADNESTLIYSTVNLKNLEGKILESVKDVVTNVAAYTEKTNGKIEQQALVLYLSLSPYVTDLQEKLKTQCEATSLQMKTLVDQMKASILTDAIKLKDQVSLYINAILSKKYSDFSTAKKMLDVYLTDTSVMIFQFKNVVTLNAANLNKVLVQQLEDLKNIMGVDSMQE